MRQVVATIYLDLVKNYSVVLFVGIVFPNKQVCGVGIPLKFNKVFGQFLLIAMLFKALIPTLVLAQTAEFNPANPALSNIVICTATGIKVVSFNPETGDYEEQNAPNGDAHDCQICQALHQAALNAGATSIKYSAGASAFAAPSSGQLNVSAMLPSADSAPRAPPITLI